MTGSLLLILALVLGGALLGTVSAVPYVPRDGTLTVVDGSGVYSVTVPYEDGDYQHSDLWSGQYDETDFFDRGAWYAARKVKQNLPTFGFSCHATDFTDATDKLLRDLVRRQNACSAAVSTLGATADCYTLNVSFNANTAAIGGVSATVAHTNCQLKIAFAEGEPGKFTLTGLVRGSTTDT